MFQPGDAQVVPFLGRGREKSTFPAKIPLTVLSFSDTLVLTCQKARRSRRWPTFPPTSGCGRGSDERTRLPKGTRQWANEETCVCEPRICMRGRAHRPRSLADLSQGPVAGQGAWQPTQNPRPFMVGSISTVIYNSAGRPILFHGKGSQSPTKRGSQRTFVGLPASFSG